MPVKAAERLEVQFDEMSIPIPIDELINWMNGGNTYRSELKPWLNLLDPESRAGLTKLLHAPLFKDRSMARQLLRSWVGRQLLDELSDFVRLDNLSRGEIVLKTLEFLLERQPQVTSIDLLKALPAKTVHFDLDALLAAANKWKKEIDRQQELASSLQNFRTSSIGSFKKNYFKKFHFDQKPEIQLLKVPHRKELLNLEIWKPKKNSPFRKSWIVFMPGLGGSQDHFRWIAHRLANKGWPIVVLDHPGSDAKALQGLIQGEKSVPGVEVFLDRLSDLNSVLDAKAKGELNLSGSKIVLMGHSLGALTALLASGAYPVKGLPARCEEALEDLSLTNLSQLLQCQLVNTSIPKQREISELEAIVAINSFGSLLWPRNGNTSIDVPVLFTGGTMDIITPPVSEQLEVSRALSDNSLSRVLLVEGASHFSPIRVQGQMLQKKGDDLFQLGDSLVGVQPLLVQDLLGGEIIRYIDQLESNQVPALSEHKKKGDLRFHLLDRFAVDRLINIQ